jgi:hypothetical protein
MTRGRVGVYRRAKWQKLKWSFVGDYEVTDLIIEAKSAGKEGA